MKVFALVGPCGAGKTTIIEGLPAQLRRHKEGYVQKDDEVFIDNKTYLSKLRYLNAWYLEMIRLKQRKYRKVVSDRCPYDVAAYVRDEGKQHEMVREYMTELEGSFGVRVCTIYVYVSLRTCKQRVAERLSREPWRRKYHENDSAFLKKTRTYYEQHKADWDFVVENDGDVKRACDDVRRIVSG